MPQLEQLASSHPQLQSTQPAALFVLYLFRIAAIVIYIIRGFFTDNYVISVRLAQLPTHLYDSPLFGGRNRCRSPPWTSGTVVCVHPKIWNGPHPLFYSTTVSERCWADFLGSGLTAASAHRTVTQVRE